LEARAEESKGRVRLGSVLFSIPPRKTLILDPLLGTPFSGGRPVQETSSSSSSKTGSPPKSKPRSTTLPTKKKGN
jgi:hypothetical protein